MTRMWFGAGGFPDPDFNPWTNRPQEKERTSKGRLEMKRLTLLMMALFVFFDPSYSFALSRCHPLLLMVEGGKSSSGSQSGTGIEKLAQDITPEYSRKGIVVASVDNDPFWTDWDEGWELKENVVKKFTDHIEASRFSPIVIVGHSWGSDTAWRFAKRLHPTLLVTLDPVSYLPVYDEAPVYHPGRPTYWINVRAYDLTPWLLGCIFTACLSNLLTPSTYFPYWHDKQKADTDSYVYTDHFNPKHMFMTRPIILNDETGQERRGLSANARVRTALKCSRARRRHGFDYDSPIISEFCKAPGIKPTSYECIIRGV